MSTFPDRTNRPKVSATDCRVLRLSKPSLLV
jgi:hypothetical protein